MTTQAIQKNWRAVRLEEIADFQYGYTASSKEADTGTKLLRITDIVPDLIDWETVPFCDIDEKKVKQYEIKKGDILIARTGATAGYAKLIRRQPQKSVFASYLIRLTMKGADADPDYVGRIIESDIFKQFVTTHAGGAAQPHANAPVLKNFELLLPDIKTQTEIVNVLSVYDDLIENNTRRIKILEQMAQAIYTEWFVNFRFPGHEKVKMIDSGTDLGEIPEGWGISSIGSILDIKSGHTFKSKSYISTGAYKVVTIKNIHDGKFVSDFNCISEIPKSMPNHCHLADGDILLSLTGNVGRVSIVYGENLLLNQRVGKVVPKNALYKSFIYLLFRSENFKKRLELLSNGVAQQNLSPVQTLDLKIVLPPTALITEFDNLIAKLITLTVNLNKQKDNLSKSRDLLLPKLVTGEIRV